MKESTKDNFKHSLIHGIGFSIGAVIGLASLYLIFLIFSKSITIGENIKERVEERKELRNYYYDVIGNQTKTQIDSIITKRNLPDISTWEHIIGFGEIWWFQYNDIKYRVIKYSDDDYTFSESGYKNKVKIRSY